MILLGTDRKFRISAGTETASSAGAFSFAKTASLKKKEEERLCKCNWIEAKSTNKLLPIFLHARQRVVLRALGKTCFVRCLGTEKNAFKMCGNAWRMY